MTVEDTKKEANTILDRARLADSLMRSKGWKEVFEPILDEKIAHYGNVENATDLNASKEAVRALKSLKEALVDIKDQAEEAKRIRNKTG